MVPDETQEIFERLRHAISTAEGIGVLHENAGRLDDSLVSLLRDEADRLRDTGDKSGVEEMMTWVDEARSVVTRNLIFSAEPSGAEEAMAIIQANRERFDTAFVQLCVRIATEFIAKLHAFLETPPPDDPGALAQAKDLAAAASREITFINLVSSVSDLPEHKAQALLTGGLFLLVEARLEKRLGDSAGAERSRDKSRKLLMECAALPGVSKQIRARAEGNLAVLAGPANLREVKERQKNAQRLAEEAGDREMVRRVRRDRAYWFRKEGALDEALELYRKNIEDTEKALFEFSVPILWADEVAAAQPDYDGAVELCLELASQDERFGEQALEYTEKAKARAFLRSLASLGSSGPGAPARLIERREEIRRRMESFGSALASLPPDLAEKRRRESETLQMALARTEAGIEEYMTARALDLQCVPRSFADLAALAPRNGAILSFYTLDEKVLLFLLDTDGLTLPPVSVELSRQDLARVMVNIDLTLRIRGDYRTYDELQRKLDMEVDYFWPTKNLRFLHEKLIAPIREHLNGKTLLYIAPHGALRDIPFQALIEPDGKSLVDRFAIAYAPSLSILRHCRENARSELSSCFAAGVDSDSGGPENAAGEAAAVAGFFGTTSRPATKEALRSEAGEADVIHLACHSDPSCAYTSLQGLKMEDGLLRQQEIAAMRTRASLVCLSACETAHADLLPQPGQEMAGLVGAFMRAGAPSVMATMWPLSDRVALPLMRTLYGELKNGMNKAEALQAAQRAIKEEKRYSHPYFWAPLCLWGAM